MSSSELEQWLRRLEQIHPKNIDLGLERVAAVADTLSLRSPRQPVVTVAGTNGKGSVVAVLEAALAQDGRRVGAFTSPHLQRFNERIRVDGQEATDAEIMAAFTAIDRARGETSLTYFEFAALAALWVFRERQVDVLLLEVGLGGRLDAVNIIDASLAVITSIALDHQDWLGDSREVIAVEKAGVLRPGIPVVVADPEPPASLTACIRDAGAAPALLVGRHFGAQEGTGEWQGWLQRDGVRCDLAPVPDGPLLPQNVCAALQAAVLLGVDVERIDLPALLAHAAPDGRRQFIHCGGLDYLLDVAHNPAAVQKLLEYVELSNCKKRKIAVFSAMSDKDIDGMIGQAAGMFDAWFIADQPDNARAADAAAIAQALRDAGQSMVSNSRNLRQALRRAQSVAGRGDLVVVFGSFSTVAEALAVLEKDRGKCGAL